MKNNLLFVAALCAMLAVILGAFGAHGLKSLVESRQLAIFETGVRYQFYHAFGMLVAGILDMIRPSKRFRGAGWLFFIGILLFSGSLYLLATRFVLGIESWTWLGPVTPVGGVLFIMGWGMLGYGIVELEKLKTYEK